VTAGHEPQNLKNFAAEFHELLHNFSKIFCRKKVVPSNHHRSTKHCLVLFRN